MTVTNQTTSNEQRRTFHALDAARGIAALIVVLHHLPVPFRGTFVGSGFLAVDLFFGLSGFVLAHAYLNRLVSGRLGLREFMVARLVRLYPLYLLSLLAILALSAGMYLASIPLPWSALAVAGKLPFAVLMLPSPTLDWHGYLYPFNIAAWSIFMEMGVNFLFAIICRPISRPRTRWVVIGISGSVLFAQLLMQDVLGGASWDLLAAGIPRVCFSFFLGIQIHEWLKHRHHASPIHSGWTLLSLGLLLAILCAPDHLWIKLVAIFGIFPVLILVLGSSDVPRGLAGTALRKLGVLSYAIYMMHGPVLFAWLMLYLTPDVWTTKPALVAAPLLVCVVVVSWATDRWLDAPIRAWVVQYLRNRKSTRKQLA